MLTLTKNGAFSLEGLCYFWSIACCRTLDKHCIVKPKLLPHPKYQAALQDVQIFFVLILKPGSMKCGFMILPSPATAPNIIRSNIFGLKHSGCIRRVVCSHSITSVIHFNIHNELLLINKHEFSLLLDAKWMTDALSISQLWFLCPCLLGDNSGFEHSYLCQGLCSQLWTPWKVAHSISLQELSWMWWSSFNQAFEINIHTYIHFLIFYSVQSIDFRHA